MTTTLVRQLASSGNDTIRLTSSRQRLERPAASAAAEPVVNADDKLLLSVEEAARRLGIGRSLMYELISSQQVASVHVGRLRRIRPDALRAYVDELTDDNVTSDHLMSKSR